MMESTPFFAVEDMCKRYKIKQSTLYEWVRTKGLPKPLKFGRLSRWRLTDLEAWESGLNQEISPSPEARIAAVRKVKASGKRLEAKLKA